MSVECVFGDWQFSLLDESVAAFRPGHIIPLTWNDWQIAEVHLADVVAETMPYVALVAHWAQAHPAQLEALVGPVEVARWPRTTALPW